MLIFLGVAILLLVTLGCTSAARTEMAYEAARAAVDGIADRFHITEPNAAVSPLQGLLGSGGVMLLYLIRKKWFPMMKR